MGAGSGIPAGINMWVYTKDFWPQSSINAPVAPTMMISGNRKASRTSVWVSSDFTLVVVPTSSDQIPGNVLSAKAPDEKIPFIADSDLEVYKKYRDAAFEVQVGLHELTGMVPPVPSPLGAER